MPPRSRRHGTVVTGRYRSPSPRPRWPPRRVTPPGPAVIEPAHATVGLPMWAAACRRRRWPSPTVAALNGATCAMGLPPLADFHDPAANSRRARVSQRVARSSSVSQGARQVMAMAMGASLDRPAGTETCEWPFLPRRTLRPRAPHQRRRRSSIPSCVRGRRSGRHGCTRQAWMPRRVNSRAR